MTPQPRHIEAAGRVTLEWYKNHVPAVSPETRTLLTLAIAIALAEAENRAAWDGWDEGQEWMGESLQIRYDKIVNDFKAKYGPRPTKENQP